MNIDISLANGWMGGYFPLIEGAIVRTEEGCWCAGVGFCGFSLVIGIHTHDFD